MSTYEKVATIIIALLLIPLVFFSFREITEPKGIDRITEQPSFGGDTDQFDTSIGKDFIIGEFNTMKNNETSTVLESDCASYQSLVISALHDIKERLEHMKPYNGHEDPFKVNSVALDIFCHKEATTSLSDAGGNVLILHKIPFVRKVPAEGSQKDIGTEVHIDATLVSKGGKPPTTPTVFGDVFIPDRYLDTASSTGQRDTQ